MTPENFCYWLQGLLEVGNPEQLNKEQLEMIKEHLNLVFKKETRKTNFNLTELSKFFDKPAIERPYVPDHLNPWKNPTIIC